MNWTMDTEILLPKHKGKTVREVVATDPEYLDWLKVKFPYDTFDDIIYFDKGGSISRTGYFIREIKWNAQNSG